jgi:SSS family solute:Na+ symporter/sodium/pantothenate symporter
MGYPSLVYSYGWIVLLWIAGYMVVPITGFGILGKRVAQLSRRTGALTVPDLLRERFDSPAVGVVESLSIMFFLMFTMIAQFKAGAVIMQVSWPTGSESSDVPAVAAGESAPPTTAAGQSDSATDRSSAAAAAPTEQPTVQPAGQSGAGKAAGGLAGRMLDEAQRGYVLGLAVFAITVVGYTLIGGFLASVWTDLFQSVLMVVGVTVLLVGTLSQLDSLEAASRHAAASVGPGFLTGPGADPNRSFLPVTLAFSFFAMWVFSGVSQPAGIVRLMASRDTNTLRRSIALLSVYNMFIYIPLAIVCVGARSLIPDLPTGATDQVIPRMAFFCAPNHWGGSFISGLVLAAPFGAVMASVSTFLVVISSGVVRDVYQRVLNPQASERAIRSVTYVATLVVGGVAVLVNLNPPDYLQALIVFSSAGTGSALLVPAVMAAFWRRATAAGTLAAMLAGAATVFGLLLLGWNADDPLIGPKTDFRPYYLLGLDPFVWGVSASAICGVVGSLLTRPPDAPVVARLFDAPGPTAGA